MGSGLLGEPHKKVFNTILLCLFVQHLLLLNSAVFGINPGVSEEVRLRMGQTCCSVMNGNYFTCRNMEYVGFFRKFGETNAEAHLSIKVQKINRWLNRKS